MQNESHHWRRTSDVKYKTAAQSRRPVDVLVGPSLVCCLCPLRDLCCQRGAQLIPGELATRVCLAESDMHWLAGLSDNVEPELLQSDIRIHPKVRDPNSWNRHQGIACSIEITVITGLLAVVRSWRVAG